MIGQGWNIFLFFDIETKMRNRRCISERGGLNLASAFALEQLVVVFQRLQVMNLLHPACAEELR